jgi:hypothetical protein
VKGIEQEVSNEEMKRLGKIVERQEMGCRKDLEGEQEIVEQGYSRTREMMKQQTFHWKK